MAEDQFEYRPDGLRRIDSDEADPFGHRDYAAAVVAALDALPPHFTMGLFGPWGSGKSTILEEVRRRITSERADVKSGFVLFDAWRYDGDSLRREFLKVSARSLRDQKLLDKGAVEELDESLDTDQVTPEKPAMRLLDPDLYRRAAVASIAVAAVIFAAIFGLPQLGLEKETILAFLLAISSALTTFGLLALQPVIAPAPIQKTRRRAEFPDEFSAAFRELLDNSKVTRLVFAIDNLDRCSPARVTQTLATIKTFLEPAFEEGRTRTERELKQICFIVAADDGALRRHLTAQELSASGITTSLDEDQLSDGELPREVRDSVEEYLRKFFGASVRIREILDEDISRFCEGEFAGFFKSRPEIDNETRRDLIEMTSQALKRNPRRIVQFVNNLALRLDLLEERLRQSRILIEPEVLVIAKLAILEEEFPERFSELKETPQVLDTWETNARSPSKDDDEDTDEAEGSKKNEKEQLEEFLRFTDHIRSRHLRAYLDLKQGRDELELDRYAELVDLLDGGDVAGVQALLKAVDEDKERYVQAVSRHFDRQVRQGNWSKAHNALRVVSEVPALHGKEGVIASRLLDESLSHPRLTRRLPRLDPDAVLDAGDKFFDKPRFNRLVLAFSAGMEDPDSPDARHRIADAIAEHPGSLSNGTVARLRAILETNEIKGDVRSYAKLAESSPSVTGPVVATASLEQLEGLVGEEHYGYGPELRVAVIAVGRTLQSDEFARLVGLGKQMLEWLRENGSDEYADVALSLRALLRTARETKGDQLPGGEERTALAAALADNWSSVPIGSKWEAMRLGYELCVGGDEADAQRGFELGQKALDVEEGVGVEGWLVANLSEMPSRFGEAVREEVAYAVAGSRQRLSPESAQKIVAQLPADEQAMVIARAVRIAIAEQQSERLDELLGSMSADGIAATVTEIAQQLRSHPAEIEQRSGEADFLSNHQELLDEGQIFESRNELGGGSG